MKKFLTIVMAMVMMVLPMAARDRIARSADVLPAPAQTMLKKYFPKAEVSHVRIEKHTFGGVEYDVVLDDGTEIDFDSQGAWTEVDCGHKAVPDGLVLNEISTYVKTNFKKQPIVQIKKERKYYEVELLNGLDLIFNRDGKFVRVDD